MVKNIPQVLDGIHIVFVAPFSSTMWIVHFGAHFTIGMHTSCVKPLSNMFGATLTLLRAGIAEGFCIFEMPCRWTFSMWMYMWSMLMIMIIIIIIVIVTVIKIIIIIIIPDEGKLMLLSDSAYLSKGVVDLLIPYEDKLMWVPRLAYLSEGVVDFWPLVKIS